ncbi:stonustoxin subunit alpha-like [Pseudorasbora parva]|uniref:stonustoxin subunit alpha-like n=1 Tax=Pseudorasbora parva TaxID=51549 RepID=UPI00351E585D
MVIFSGSAQNPGSSVLYELQLSNGLYGKAGLLASESRHNSGSQVVSLERPPEDGPMCLFDVCFLPKSPGSNWTPRKQAPQSLFEGELLDQDAPAVGTCGYQYLRPHTGLLKSFLISGVTLWDEKSLREDLDTRAQPKTDLKFSSSDSLSSKASLLDVSASLKASFLGGLVKVGGSGKFLRDTKSSDQQSRVTMSYSETTRFEQLTMSHLGQITYPQVFDQKTATHVVTAVLYGAKAYMVFDQRFSEEENKQKIEGELNIMVKTIPEFSIEGEGALEMTDGEKKMAESIACTFHGDFRLDQNPTTYMEAIKVYKKLRNILKENPQNAVPLKVWLYPLSLLDSKAAQLEREITTRLVSNTEDIMEELGRAERTCSDLSRKTLVNAFNDIKERLQSFQNLFNIYKTILQKAVARVLPAIRGGDKQEKSLEDVLKIHYSSPFKAEKLNQWLDGAKSELDLLSSHTNVLEGITTEDSDHLSSILFNPAIDVVVCLTFTSLKYEDPYLSNLTELLKSDKFKELDGELNMVTVASVRTWFSDPAVISKMKDILSLFRRFSEANKDEKKYRFIISAISDPSSPGSSIRLYEKGKLTDTQFQPVSKPPPPDVKDVLPYSVSLKLQKSPTGETVQFRVEYQQENREEWHAIDTPDENFNLTGLASRMQYLIRYWILGKVGVSEASDTIGPIMTPVPDHKTTVTGNWSKSDFLHYSLRLNLDLNTVNKDLRLSADNRVITNPLTDHSYPDHPDRFERYQQVLCRESVSGRSYWEVDWSGDGVWIAVSYKSISRKGRGHQGAFGAYDHAWSLQCHRGKYSFWHKKKMTELHEKPIGPRYYIAGVYYDSYRTGLSGNFYRVGVFVDHRAGTLSFYSISGDSMIPIHSFQTTFTQPLYPGFNIGSHGSLKLL